MLRRLGQESSLSFTTLKITVIESGRTGRLKTLEFGTKKFVKWEKLGELREQGTALLSDVEDNENMKDKLDV